MTIVALPCLHHSRPARSARGWRAWKLADRTRFRAQCLSARGLIVRSAVLAFRAARLRRTAETLLGFKS